MGEAAVPIGIAAASSAASTATNIALSEESQGGIATGFGGAGGTAGRVAPGLTETQRASISQFPTTQTLQRRSESNTFGAPDSQRALQSGLLRRRLELLRG
jgi:hypothetical protein